MTEGVGYSAILVEAALENGKVGKIFEQQMAELEKEWNDKLKLLARDRLEVLLNVYKYFENRQTAGHLDASVKGRSLKMYLKKEIRKAKERRLKKMNKFDLQYDEIDTIPLHLPPISQEITNSSIDSTLVSISTFAEAWNLTMSEKDIFQNHKSKPALIDELNRSLRQVGPGPIPSKIKTKKGPILSKSRKAQGRRASSSTQSLPEIRQTSTGFPDLPGSFSPPTEKSIVNLPAIKTPTLPKLPTKTYNVDNPKQTSQEEVNISPKTEKKVKNPRFMFPGIV